MCAAYATPPPVEINCKINQKPKTYKALILINWLKNQMELKLILLHWDD